MMNWKDINEIPDEVKENPKFLDKTLYSNLVAIDKAFELTGELINDKQLNKIDEMRTESYRAMFEHYQHNNILNLALHENQPVTESLEYLAQGSKTFWERTLPRRRNKAHNDSIKELGELISEPYQHSRDGILHPSNGITVPLYAGGICYMLFKTAFGAVIEDPVMVDLMVKVSTGLTVGFGVPLMTLFSHIHTHKYEFYENQAKFIDEKIEQYM